MLKIISGRSSKMFPHYLIDYFFGICPVQCTNGCPVNNFRLNYRIQGKFSRYIRWGGSVVPTNELGIIPSRRNKIFPHYMTDYIWMLPLDLLLEYRNSTINLVRPTLSSFDLSHPVLINSCFWFTKLRIIKHTTISRTIYTWRLTQLIACAQMTITFLLFLELTKRHLVIMPSHTRDLFSGTTYMYLVKYDKSNSVSDCF